MVADSRARVYPRPRGGTFRRRPAPRRFRGLSPPTRGNPAHGEGYRAHEGSIPAHAGEPLGRSASRGRSGVYPRPRGGTDDGTYTNIYPQGLSPPTRGNPRNDVRVEVAPGSIPAHAGEPRAVYFGVGLGMVYPRPRGGTPSFRFACVRSQGLSPPTRGNRERPSWSQAERRSIPAHAGEPDSAGARARGRGVYPRPRGGTLADRYQPNPQAGLSPPTRGNPLCTEP